MKKVLVVTLSSLNNDSRILKTIFSLQKNNYIVETISNKTTKEFNFKNYNIGYTPKRYLGIPKLGILIFWFKIFKLIFKLNLKPFNYIHCNDLGTLPIGVFIYKFLNKNLNIIYDAHEYETEMNGMNIVDKKMASFIEKRLIKYASSVITVSESIANEYVRLYNIEKPYLVLNTPKFQKIDKKDIFRETFNISKEQTIFLYQGGLNSGRGIEIILETFKELDNSSVIVFLGYGALENKIQNLAKEYSNIYFHKAVAPNILMNYTSSADFGISLIENTSLSYRYSLPNKIFEYIMAEIPLLVSNLDEMKKVVEDNKIGFIIEEYNPKSLKKSIIKALKIDKSNFKENLLIAKEKYNWEEQEKTLLSIYKNIN